MLTFSGTWIGSTRADDVVHVWRVVQRDGHAFIYAELDEDGLQTYYSATIRQECLLINGSPNAETIPLDKDHFVLSAWHDERDMLFSREGLAELLARSAWQRYDEMTK